MELEWSGRPQDVVKALGIMIAQIVETKPKDSYTILRYGPEVATFDRWPDHEVFSEIGCRYYYVKYNK